MRRKGHASFRSANTCCFLSSLKTLLMLTEAIGPLELTDSEHGESNARDAVKTKVFGQSLCFRFCHQLGYSSCQPEPYMMD